MWRVSGGKQSYFARDLLTFAKAKMFEDLKNGLKNGLKILNYRGDIGKKGIKS